MEASLGKKLAAFVTASEAPRTNSVSICPADIATLPGEVPSTTHKFGLSLLGGHADPGQCQTSVFFPASAKTFHNCSALQSLESKLYAIRSGSSVALKKQVIPCVFGYAPVAKVVHIGGVTVGIAPIITRS